MKPATPETAIRILKVATCPSSSGKSKLTYQIGCAVNGDGISTAKSEVQFRICGNSSTGFFSQEWIPLSSIQERFARVPADKAITSHILNPLFQGKSVNTPSFMFAALHNEGLVCRSKTERRRYDRVDPKTFTSTVQALIAAPVKAKPSANPAAGDKYRPAAAKAGKAPLKTAAKK